jgi:hypothetical protein
MDSASLTVIKRLARNRELKLREIAELLPKKTNDHRDYYILASLITGGYVDVWLEENPVNKQNEQELAINLYMWVVGGDKEIEYLRFRSSGGDFGALPLFVTAKGYLALDELRRKRSERIWAFAVAILTALVASALGNFGD